jgi:TRAP-type C4-dicarboxylate transport system substrate-binding protein
MSFASAIRIVAVVPALALAVAAPGDIDARAGSPTVLVMAAPDAGSIPDAGSEFAKIVQRLSKGSLVVTIRFAAQQRADGEPLVIHDVQQGNVALGWIPTRAWDAVGVPTFASLQAPLVITNYSLLAKVLEGPVGRGMRAGTLTSGIRTLGLAAVDLHVPLGARRPFVSAADFRGATFRVPSNSPLTSAILGALGGTSVAIASGPNLFAALKSGTVDGAVSSLPYVLSNGYYGAAKYLTTNLVFFPYVGSIGINVRVFNALPPVERAILEKAAAETTRRSFVGIRARDQRLLRFLCRTGLKMATASSSRLSALRRAEQPVYAALRADAATASRISKIQSLNRKSKPPPPLRIPRECSA